MQLTVEEVEPKDGTVRGTPVVDRLALPHNRISQRDKVANRRTRPDILQVWSRLVVHTTFVEIFVLLFGRIHQRVQLLEVSFVESFRYCFVYEGKRGVVPVHFIFCSLIENVNVSWAGDNIRSPNRTGELISERTMCTPPHEGPM